MATFDWVEAVDFARRQFRSEAWSLDRVAGNLESIVNDADASGHRSAQVLRAAWGELEIVNALDLDGEVAAAPAEVESLLLNFANLVKRAAG